MIVKRKIGHFSFHNHAKNVAAILWRLGREQLDELLKSWEWLITAHPEEL
jgi:hypothetical protein